MDADQVIAGRYRLTERLGGGGMGVVWQAHDERLRRTVAVKEVILPPSLDEARLEEIRRRTMREGRIAAKLHHPQLITVYDVIEDDGRPYLIMEYLPSTSLSRLLADRGTLPPAEVARIGSQAAAALAAAHAAGVVHRDVKPSNILVGDNGTVKITDFGVSRVVEDVTGTVTGTFVGTPAYLAPEVAQGRDGTLASDVYALGATLYTAVEGAPPSGTSDNPMALLHRIASGDTVAPKQAGELTGVLARLLSTDPGQRPTMQDAKRALDEVAGGVAARAAPPVPPPTAPTVAAPAAAPPPPPAPAPPATRPAAADDGSTRRRPVIVLAAIVAALLVATIAVLLINNNSTNTPPGDANAGAPPASTSARQSQVSSPSKETTSTGTTTTTTPPPASSATRPPPPGANLPTTPAAAVTDYYALMPGNPDEGFKRLTPKFQRRPAGGPDGYRQFWGTVGTVRASQVSAQGSTVEVTVDYNFTSGRHTVERHRYALVDSNGTWLIDTVSVLSSQDI
ncbi:serine/threonine-protein kinase [Actinophytocola sp.]|uniref:serine/threonine-protein kinase n=1 Tax=Actinophytocola sp. TaxID=1872138 RepID=UPI002EDA1ED1